MSVKMLPNHIIMKIIKIADGGFNTHKKKMTKVLKEIDSKSAYLQIVIHYRIVTNKAYDEDKWDEWRKFNKILRSYGIDPHKLIEKHNIMPY